MKDEELESKLNEIQYLLASNIEVMKKITAEANDPQKRSKEAEILTEASKTINSTTDEIKGLISSEKHLLANFKPVTECKHITLDQKSRLGYIWAFMALALGAMIVAGYYVYDNYELKKVNEGLVSRVNKEEAGYMKWQYNKYFNAVSKEAKQAVKEFENEYNANWKKYDQKIRDMDAKVEAQQRAEIEYKLEQEEADRKKHIADSLKNLTK